MAIFNPDRLKPRIEYQTREEGDVTVLTGRLVLWASYIIEPVDVDNTDSVLRLIETTKDRIATSIAYMLDDIANQ